jgi:serine/threonine protein kinase
MNQRRRVTFPLEVDDAAGPEASGPDEDDEEEEEESMRGYSKESASTASTGKMSCRVGTVQWMSPELLSGSTDYTDKVDVYAYGMLLYEIELFEPPFCGLDPQEIEALVLEGGRPDFHPDCDSSPLVRLAQSCWHQEADRRPPFSQVVSDLVAIGELDDWDSPW